jgi:predicted secreted protein
MLPRAIFSICLLIAIAGNAQTGRYWLLGSKQTIHFTPHPVQTNQFNNSLGRIPCHEAYKYSECKYDNPSFPSLYSDCDDSLCLFSVYDSIFSYDRKTIGAIGFLQNLYNPSIILPIPQKINQYGYIACFSDSVINGKSRYHYTQINYNRTTNKGYIYPTKRQIFLKMEGTRDLYMHNLSWAPHADGVNLWVLTLKNDTVLQAYPFDSSGIALNPVESKVKGNFSGNNYSQNYTTISGNIRPSHDFKHIVVSGVLPKDSKVYSTWLYDFDVKTGKASNGRGIIKHSEHEGSYSKAIEFSPKDSFIYISTHNDTLLYAPRLIQHNIYTGKNIQLDFFPNLKPDNRWRLYSLRLAPDGKIYGTYINYTLNYNPLNNFNGNYLACIQNPDREGKACKYKRDSIYFKYGLSWGLSNNYTYPTVMDAYINPKHLCEDTTVIRVDAKWFAQLKISWGDGDSVVYNKREWLDKPDQKHYYKKLGKYRIKLSGYMPPCNSYHEWEDSIIVLKPPISKGYTLRKDTICTQFTVALKDSTKQAYKLKVDWGNGVDSTFDQTIDVSRNFYTSQKYKLIYSVLGKDTLGVKGCKLVFSDSIKPIIYNKPAPNFTINDSTQCLNSNSFDFINTTIDTLNTIYQWDLGDQTYNNKKHIFGKIYLKDSTYKIRLITNTVNNCADTLIKTIEVVSNPKVDFSWDITCNKTKTNFSYTGTKPSTTSFVWNFNNESPSYLENPSYLFSVAGIKKVGLIVNSSNGCSDTMTKDVEIKVQSKAEFKVKDVCESDSVEFTNLSIDATGYSWKFGDGNTSKIENPKHRYQITSTTTYNVTLVALVENGCSDSVVNAVTVNQNPNSDFTAIQTGDKLELKAKAGYTKYKWEIENEDSISTTNPNYTYDLKKYTPHKICLTVTDAVSCNAQSCKTITLGISKILKPYGFNIYPNPNSGNFTVEIENPVMDVTIEVFDLVGNLIECIETDSSKKTYSIDLKVAKGIYLVRVKNGGMAWNQRVVVE